ncbi:MAG: AAA family ATPase [candidate division TM6 bacterium GW2011_GWF2_37_49]|nr:MAG: AAA family ATPase [candidate division TM6 bacterium GW2011_GWF2_37_49]
MMIKRELFTELLSVAKQFPAVAVMGPRQSGKSTLVKAAFPDYAYVSLEDIDKRTMAKDDPRGFLGSFSQRPGVIIDEVQEVPELLSYMQGIIDQRHRPGFFILTGSQHFLMYEKITQTLAGRIALLTLLPLSVNELADEGLLAQDVESQLIKGFYPRLYSQEMDVERWCANYVSTYVEKDVRQVLKITDVLTFQKFLKLCAARVGNLLNYADFARDCDISPHTAKEWICVLETSFVIKLLAPYHNNFNKRVTKSPKLYFYDTALICSLLGIRTAEELYLHPLKSAIFESFVVSEIFKYSFNRGLAPQIYFWRDVQGHEIDCVIEKSLGHTIPIEVKAGKTVGSDFFKGLIDWQKITDQREVQSYVVYGGSDDVVHKQGRVFAWKSISKMLQEI